MSKHTTRDYVWHHALAVADDRRDSSRWRKKFTAGDVLDRLDADDRFDGTPSRRTVRETLATMADLGDIESRRTQGQYEPAERAEDDAGRAGSSGGSSVGSPVSRTVTTRTPSVGGRETDETPSETTADPTEGFDPTADTDELLADARDESDDEASDQPAPDLVTLVMDLDVPGTDDVADARRYAVSAVLDYLQRQPATQSELRDEVYPDHSGGYGSSRGWWEHLVLPALRDLADQHDDLRPPGGRGPWRLEE